MAAVLPASDSMHKKQTVQVSDTTGGAIICLCRQKKIIVKSIQENTSYYLLAIL